MLIEGLVAGGGEVGKKHRGENKDLAGHGRI